MNEKTETKMDSGEVRKRTVSKKSYRILLAEDDREMRTLLANALREAEYEVAECSNGFTLLTHLGHLLLPGVHEYNEVDLIISDIRMPGVTGMEILHGAYEIGTFPPIIMITAFGDEKTHAQAKEFGAAAIFDKPFDIDAFIDKVRNLLTPYGKLCLLTDEKIEN